MGGAAGARRVYGARTASLCFGRGGLLRSASRGPIGPAAGHASDARSGGLGRAHPPEHDDDA
jgi:hypothetical protein